MPFPETERVVFKKNPLEQVICELRYNPILRIDTDVPVDFQDEVRSDFPGYEENIELQVNPSQIGQPIQPPEFLNQLIHPNQQKIHKFTSSDGYWVAGLTHSSISLSTNKYQNWQDFKKRLTIPFKALIKHYTPNDFTRIGLRYIDVIKRSELKLDNVDWAELIEPHILGITGAPKITDSLLKSENRHEILLKDKISVVRLITKLVTKPDRLETCFLMDSDFFCFEINIDEALGKLDYFNKRAHNLMQWCFSDHLKKALEPI